MDKPITTEPFPPGEYIKDEMDARGWTQDDLADVIGKTRQTVNRLIQGKTGVTPEMAHALGAAFGTSSEMWMGLQTSYELAKAVHDTREIERRSKIYDKFPIATLVKRKWIPKTETTEELEEALSIFLETESIEAPPKFQIAARKSDGGEIGAQWSWYSMVRRMSHVAPAAKYTGDVEECIGALCQLTQNPRDVSSVPKLLADFGIRLVIVKHLPRTKIDGVATWVNGSPVVGLSLRYGRVDNFWFNLLHELVHIKYHDESPVDTEEMFDSSQESPIEQRANREAANYLIPREKIDSFILRAGPLFYQKRVIQFANANGIHPGIVVGQLQNKEKLDYSQHRKLLAPIRDYVIEMAITDGWGNNIQI